MTKLKKNKAKDESTKRTELCAPKENMLNDQNNIIDTAKIDASTKHETENRNEKIRRLTLCGLEKIEVMIACGLSEFSPEEELQPFENIFWDAKIEYGLKIREWGMNLAQYAEDENVRERMIKYLLDENKQTFDKKAKLESVTDYKRMLTVICGNLRHIQVNKHLH